MLFDLKLSGDKLWLQSYKIDQKLSEYAQLSLIQEQKSKDDFIQNSQKDIQQLNWDSIHGACYQLGNDTATFSIDVQANLARFLLASGITFFDGDLNHLGCQLLEAIINFLYSKEKGYFNSEVVFQSQQVPCVVSGKQLLENLVEQEVLLLSALINQQSFVQNKSYWIKYQTSLQVAADKSNINYKQAQILENILHNKLKRITAGHLNRQSLDETINIENNALMIRLIVQITLWNNKDNYQFYLEKLAENFKSQLDDVDNILNSEKLIYICYSLLDYCQINYQPNLVQLIYNKIINMPLNPELTERAQCEFYEMLTILQAFSHKTEILDQSGLKLIKSFKETLKLEHSLKVHFLNSKHIADHNQRQVLLSCYNPYLKIYSIS